MPVTISLSTQTIAALIVLLVGTMCMAQFVIIGLRLSLRHLRRRSRDKFER